MTELAYFLVTIPVEKATDEAVGQLHQEVRKLWGDLDYLGDFHQHPRPYELAEKIMDVKELEARP